MEPYVILALQVMHDEARSALPDAPVVPDRPTLLHRLTDRLAATRLAMGARPLRAAVLPKRTEVRRAA